MRVLGPLSCFQNVILSFRKIPCMRRVCNHGASSVAKFHFFQESRFEAFRKTENSYTDLFQFTTKCFWRSTFFQQIKTLSINFRLSFRCEWAHLLVMNACSCTCRRLFSSWLLSSDFWQIERSSLINSLVVVSCSTLDDITVTEDLQFYTKALGSRNIFISSFWGAILEIRTVVPGFKALGPSTA